MSKTLPTVDDSASIRRMVSFTLKQAGEEAGATGWIAKPFKPDRLPAVVKKVPG